MSYCILYATAGSLEEAKTIARNLVQERLVACANLLPGMSSVFFWEGEAREEAEVVIILKTRTELAEVVTRRIREMHSYSCPCVVQISISGGNPAFLDWIGGETDANRRD